ncbi:MAG: hypothetical protein DSZ35_10310 [Verrucomicrobia bacterium]|nr:MAG: hypothetical protein DSZ35_10310 [Verrucomicrobiota bacterium]
MKEFFKIIVPIVTYPVLMGTCLLLHYLILDLDFSLQIATYIPVAVGLTVITLMELKFPHRQEWLAKRGDVLNDLSYMFLVQVLLVKILSFFFSITLLKMLRSSGYTFDRLWPDTWPVYTQAVLMVLSADFLRYWLHRLSHKWMLLWRLHAVHHSPHKLYWINVGRFHPIEKGLQFLFDSLPFIVLGVSGKVLALYFVFFAINGFFQHCNIELKLGPLNYIVSGPELHRWHHSVVLGESNKNYGNNLIIWDLVFGTWYLPKTKMVRELGLKNRKYPLDFLSQLKTPFKKGMDQG